MKIMSIDAETNGLWGRAFMIAGVVIVDGLETEMFLGRCPITEKLDPWVAENVIPKVMDVPQNYHSYFSMMQAFAEWYLAKKEGAVVIVHMGTPVEAGIFIDLQYRELIGSFDGPYPLIDISGNLDQAGFDPTSVDAFNAANGIAIDGNPHDPLYDSRAAAACYRKLKGE